MERNAEHVATALRVVYSAVPVVAGADKFTNLLVDWTHYIPAPVEGLLPMSPAAFMGVVGVIEIAAGLLVMSRWTKIGAWVVSAWLVAIAVNLILGGYYDIAVRDLVMAIGAWSYGHLAEPADSPSRVARMATPA